MKLFVCGSFSVLMALGNFQPAVAATPTPRSCAFTILSLNVENAHPAYETLPDRVFEFTPIEALPFTGVRPVAGSANHRLANWTREKLEVKLGQMGKAVSSLPKKPDFAAVIEVRDASVTSKIARALGFSDSMVSNSSSERGMDVGFMFREESTDSRVISTREVPLVGPEFANHRTRNLFVITVRVADRFLLHYIVAHWPSQGGPTESRIQAAHQTRDLVEELMSDNPGSEVIVMGDFNTLEDEQDALSRHPFRDVLLKGTGDASLLDIYDRAEFHADIRQPPGTYYYAPKDQWNRLDHFFVTPGLLAKKPVGLRVTPKSFAIHAPDEVTVEHTRPGGEIIKVPAAYNFEATTSKDAGFEDHFGIYMGVEAHWLENNSPENKIGFEDAFVLTSVVLFPKTTGAGARKYITWAEYAAEKDKIGSSGEYADYKIDAEKSFAALNDEASGEENGPLGDLEQAMRRKSETAKNAWQGTKWADLVSGLNDAELARKLVIEIPSHRSHRPETIYQLLLKLWDERVIKFLPPLGNIRQLPAK